MTHLVPAAMRARKRRGPFAYLLNLDLPDGENRWGLVPYNSTAEGMFKSKILQAGSLVRDASERTGKLAAVEQKFTVDDTDRFISKAIEGPLGEFFEYSPAMWRRACPALAPADWLTLFTGVLRLGALRHYQWELTLRANDRPLYQDAPRGWAITRSDWPNADASALDKIAPWIYGRHSMLGVGDTGQVPTLPVSTISPWTRLVSALWCKAVPRVYRKGATTTLLTEITDYTITHPVVNGKQFTCIDLTFDPGTDEISCDVDGIELFGDGTGALIENPAKEFAHFLCNAVYADHLSGLYQYTAAPLYISGGLPFEFAQLYCDAFSVTGSHIFDEPLNGIDALDEFSEDQDFRAFWKTSGLLDLGLIDHRFTDLYGDLTHVQQTDEIGDSFSFTPKDDTEIVDGVTIEYLRSAAAGQYLYKLAVIDTSVLEQQSMKSISLPWSAAYS